MASTRQPTRPQPARQRPAPRGMAAPLILGYAAAAYLLFLAVLGVGITFEERDLRRDLGEPYRACRRRVPALIPALRPRSRRSTTGQGENPA